MNSWTEFFEMGGYAVYIWPAYGIAAVVMSVMAFASWRALVTERAILEKLEAAHGERRPRKAAKNSEAGDGR
jgi:heme exporter protein D